MLIPFPGKQKNKAQIVAHVSEEVLDEQRRFSFSNTECLFTPSDSKCGLLQALILSPARETSRLGRSPMRGESPFEDGSINLLFSHDITPLSDRLAEGMDASSGVAFGNDRQGKKNASWFSHFREYSPDDLFPKQNNWVISFVSEPRVITPNLVKFVLTQLYFDEQIGLTPKSIGKATEAFGIEPFFLERPKAVIPQPPQRKNLRFNRLGLQIIHKKID